MLTKSSPNLESHSVRSPEMDKNQLNARMLARITGVDASMIQTNTQCYWEQIAQGIGQMVELPWKVYEHSSPTTTMIASAVRRAIANLVVLLGLCLLITCSRFLWNLEGNMAFEVGKLPPDSGYCQVSQNPLYFWAVKSIGEIKQRLINAPIVICYVIFSEVQVCDQLIMLYRDAVYTKDQATALSS
ncbi:MAG: hypothetical protein ACYTXT_29010 [Nostoc sp.]